ncbi:hypothetical protein R84865_002238 [Carnimonas sp. R-84865]
MKKLFITALAILLISGCTDAKRARLLSYGSAANVSCYSGGRLVLDDLSTGRVISDESGSGVYYESANTGKFVHTYADCIIKQKI